MAHRPDSPPAPGKLAQDSDTADPRATVRSMGLADRPTAPRRRHLVVAGRRAHVTQADLDVYTGLVSKTTFMWFEACGLEAEDLRQELWLKVTQALLAYDPVRSKMTEKNYVFSLVFNRVKDFLRREKVKRNFTVAHRDGEEVTGLRMTSIQAQATGRDGEARPTDAFECAYLSIEREDCRELLVGFLPAGLSDLEVRIAALLAMSFEHAQIVAILGCSQRQVKSAARALRLALADARPAGRDVAVSGVVAVVA